MKYIKTYEDNTNEPQVDDYVIAKLNPGYYRDHGGGLPVELKYFINNNIAQITKIINYNAYREFYIKYENVPTEIKIFIPFNTRRIEKEEILHWSPKKLDLEIYIDTDKYNL